MLIVAGFVALVLLVGAYVLIQESKKPLIPAGVV